MHDDKEIAIQIVPDAAQADADSCEEMQFVMIKVWNPTAWTLSDPFELWVPKIGSLQEFATIISARTQIPAESIDCAKIISPWNFHRVELPYIHWVHLSAEAVAKNSIS